jgi:hypothetical protein
MTRSTLILGIESLSAHVIVSETGAATVCAGRKQVWNGLAKLYRLSFGLTFPITQ